ncbi:GIY-YIG nuclease family protein [Moheibacter stercoris]|uniref:GIY-YIG superfamily endonuclease n=1 Tax=Moheibacter stercoris TaxID=1628251 RepID=A0ABV2LVE3_9FLAO
MFLVYILHSNKLNRFYIGFTEDIETRMEFYLNKDQNNYLRYI